MQTGITTPSEKSGLAEVKPNSLSVLHCLLLQKKDYLIWPLCGLWSLLSALREREKEKESERAREREREGGRQGEMGDGLSSIPLGEAARASPSSSH